MTGEVGPEDLEALRSQAADFLVRVSSDAAGEDDWLALEAWLAESPARRAVFDEAESLWAELDDHAAVLRLPAQTAVAEVVVFPARSPGRRPWLRRAPAWAIAASVVIAVAGVWFLKAASTPPTQAIATAIGEQRSVRLADGSQVTLSSATRLLASTDRRRRRVTLEGGEAAFDVAKDSSHPFIVSVGDQRVTVVGTEFDILRHNGRIVVTVSRGLVDVSPALARGGGARLAPGEQLRHLEGASTSSVSKIAVADVFAWRNGYLVYRTGTLAAVAEDLNRYFPTPIVVEGPAAQLTFSGALKIDNEDAVLGRLRSFLPISVDRTPGRITIRSR